MELKQLEFFLVACECGSLNKAAEKLFTSQPNVSKVISALEKELGYKLFERHSKGLRITPKGKSVREYASHALKNIDIIKRLDTKKNNERLSVSSYSSNMIAHLLVDLYRENPDIIIQHQQGTVEEITDQVSCGESEIGILYISARQLQAFRHIISHKRLKFVALDTKEACIYVGPNHPLYKEESIDFKQIHDLHFISGTREFFSMEHHLEQVSVGAISTEQLQNIIYTNSDHTVIDFLLHSDICSLGIDFMHPKYKEYDIKALKINGCEPFLSIGYVYEEEHIFSPLVQCFIDRFKGLL